MSDKVSKTGDLNLEYYGKLSEGRTDYWRRMAAPRARVERFLQLLLRDKPSNLVDLGCGNGTLLATIAASLKQGEFAGIDLSPAQIASNQTANPNVNWLAYDLCGNVSLPEGMEGRFQAVVSSEVIEHVESPEVFLTRARGLAREGGKLYLSTQSGKVRETERRVGHVRHFSATEMWELLVSAGWNPIAVWNEGFPFHDLSKWYANRDPDGSMQRFGRESYGWSERMICFGLRALFKLNSGHRGAQLYAVASAR